MILKHRDRALLCFEWVRGARVRILSVNDAERRFLPLEFGDERLSGGCDALRYPLEDWLASRSAPVGRHFMRNLMDSLGLNINSPDYPRRAVLSGFLQKRASEIRCFGRKADEKSKQSLNVASANSKENVGVKSSSGSHLNASEQRTVQLILRNSFITEEDLANQLGVTLRQAERIVAALKKKAGLIRRGSDKTGEWYFDV